MYRLSHDSAIGGCHYVAIDYHKDSDHYVIDNRVNVRSVPNISGEKLFRLKYLTTLSDVESKMHYGFVEYFEFSNRNTITVMHISKSRENGTPSVSERESGGYLWNGKDFIDTGGQ